MHLSKNTFLIPCFLLLLSNSGRAQDIFREFRNITVKDGLPHGSVNFILQDYIGYIWMATDGGLAKFDSHKYTIYRQNPKDSTSISANQILTICEDNKKNLWIGTKVSLERYNRQLNNFTSFFFVNVHEDVVERVPILDIMQYSDSLFIIGTDGGGIYLFNPFENKYIQYKENPRGHDPLSVYRVSRIQADKIGNIWLATLDAGLVKFDIHSGSFTKIKQKDFLVNEVRSIMLINDNQMLVGTYGDGLWIFNIITGELKKSLISQNKEYEKDLARIFSLYFDNFSGHVLVGTDGGGLIEYDPSNNKVFHYKHQGYNPYSISNNVIKTIFIDAESNLWTGHFFAGISFSAKRNPFHNIRYNPALENSLSNSLVTCFLRDENNNIWVGTDGGGLNILNKSGAIQNSNPPNNKIISQIPSKSILALYKAGDNRIWIGTYLDGIYIYSPKTHSIEKFGSTHSARHKLNNDDIRCFFEDRNGCMWIGTNGGGIDLYDPRTDSITYIKRDDKNVANSLTLDWIRCIISDSYGFIWVGTAYGLNVYDPVNKSFTRLLHNSQDSASLSDDFIYSIFEDSHKNIWVGTSFGLDKFNRAGNNFISYTTDNGLPDNIIYGIDEDIEGNLWAITNNGLSKFNTRENFFSNFDADDGLLSNSFINGAIYKTSDNIFYLGSINGMTFFNPSEINYKISEATLVITDFKIFNQSVKIGKSYNGKIILPQTITNTEKIVISYKENVISFDFAALNYGNPSKIKYAYYLQNFDKGWISDVNKLYSATYTDLRPGEYIFRVKTLNLAKNIEKSIKIIVTPPFYQTIWFKILAILLIAGIIYYWYHNRILKIQNQKDALERKMKEDSLKYEKEQVNLRNEHLRSEMSLKNSQLTSYTLMITHKNDIMKEVKNKLTAFASNLRSNATDSEIEDLISAIDKEFKVEEDWERFEVHFNQIHKDFLIRLKEKYPELSSTNIKLIAYLKMNLSSKEIASLMNISIRGVEKSRSRLRKKLNLAEEENLIYFISNF
jgi:ligand-binding sensor domain-containing protein